MYTFCTYFDVHYLSRGLALYRSLTRHAQPFQLWILCMDEDTHLILSRMALPEVRLVPLAELERGDEDLLAAKANRSRIEYYFTCTPSLPLYVFARSPEADLVTYLDADLYFYAPPAPIFEEMRDRSILILGHRFPPGQEDRYANGLYNVSYLSFRRDDQGLSCLRWWRERCNEWCHDYVDGDRFADQKYLDKWPHLFPNVGVLQHKGAGLAPWNVSQYCLHEERGAVTVDGKPLLFYHFHGLRRLDRLAFKTRLSGYGVRSTGTIRRHIYRPYLRELLAIEHMGLVPAPSAGHAKTLRYEVGSRRPAVGLRAHLSRVLRAPRWAFRYCNACIEGEHLVAIGRRVW